MEIDQNRQASQCRCQPNSLWCYWYILLVSSIEGYLFYRAINRISSVKSMPWKEDQFPHKEVFAAILLLSAAILSYLLFVLMTAIKIGNFANDGEKLGKIVAKVVTDTEALTHRLNRNGRVKKAWRHAPPIGLLFHVISAFMLMFPVVIFDSAQISGQFIDSKRILSTDLDFLSYSKQTSDLPRLPSSGGNTGHNPNKSIFASHMVKKPIPENQYPSPEFINFSIACLICLLRYPSTFWYTNKWFATSFALYQLFTAMQQCFAYNGFTVLYKFIECKPYLNIQSVDINFILPSGLVASLVYISAAILVFASSIVVFEYGHTHYFQFYKRCKQKYEGTIFEEENEAVPCNGYRSNIMAMAILVLAAVCKSPVIYDWLTVYRFTSTNSKLVLYSIIADAMHVLVWIFIWFIFTIKQDWSFHIQLPYKPKRTLSHFTHGAFSDITDSFPADSPGGTISSNYRAFDNDIDDHIGMSIDSHPAIINDIIPYDHHTHDDEEQTFPNAAEISLENVDIELENSPDNWEETTGVPAELPGPPQVPQVQSDLNRPSALRGSLRQKADDVTEREREPRPKVTFNNEVEEYSNPISPADSTAESDDTNSVHSQESQDSTQDHIEQFKKLSQEDKANYIHMMEMAGLSNRALALRKVDGEFSSDDQLARSQPKYPIERRGSDGGIVDQEAITRAAAAFVHRVDSPDNTLKRDYTNEIRNKCGKIYEDIRTVETSNLKIDKQPSSAYHKAEQKSHLIAQPAPQLSASVIAAKPTVALAPRPRKNYEELNSLHQVVLGKKVPSFREHKAGILKKRQPEESYELSRDDSHDSGHSSLPSSKESSEQGDYDLEKMQTIASLQQPKGVSKLCSEV